MRPRKKPVSEQVIVVTGASSGIGLVTARLAAGAGACVVLVARNQGDLAAGVERIRKAGGRATHVTADVADPAQVDGVAAETIREFGRIDTWVNNAAVSMYGKLTELEQEDMRRQMDVNFWGTVYGSLTALPALTRSSGTLINVGSVLSERAVPHQGIYCAAKHAMRAFTDALRMELELDGVPVAVVLIKPGSVATPFFDKARTYFGEEPQPIPPVYAPEMVARTILRCAERPMREVTAGGISGLLGVGQRVSPGLTDRYLEKHGVEGQLTGRPVEPGRLDNLHEPVPNDGGERGRNWRGRVLERSLFTSSRLHPARAAWTVAGLGLATWLGVRALRRPTARIRVRSRARSEE
ncbi:MAG: SDR family oxidoreductase [Gemmatimonadales bacterium]